MPSTERVFWRTETLTVWVSCGSADGAGALVFDGYDRAHLDGYEYRVSVAPDQFPMLRAALGGDADTDVVDLVCGHAAEIIARGERAWLDDHGIERDFSAY